MFDISNCQGGLCMFTFFSQKIHLLRKSHYLSLSEFALLINLKSKGSLSTLENAKNPPSFETLMNVANVFAVKTDWLVGRSSEPYDEEIILHLEDQIMDIKINSCTLYKHTLPDEYSDIDKRGKFYSLSERANLIFLLQYMKLLIDKYPELLSTSTNENITDHLLEHFNFKKSRFNDPEEKYLYLLRAIGSILLNDIRKPLPLSSKPHIIPEPLFDITKLP